MTSRWKACRPTCPGGGPNVSFYERETIYIDGAFDTTGNLCSAPAGI